VTTTLCGDHGARRHVFQLASVVLLVLLVLLVAARLASAQERYALVVSGAAGGEPYAGRLNTWRQQTATLLRDSLRFDADHVFVFGEKAQDARPATREALTAVLEDLGRRTSAQDLVFVILFGHGSFDGVEAKFNLVGPDLDTGDWADLLRPIRARIIVVDTTGASFPFLERLSGPRRIIVTATETPAQRFDTVFPEYFVQALADPAADLDKDSRISVLEAFSAASRQVKQFYERAGQLPVERAMLDDNGDRVGKWAGGEGSDGATAARTFLDAAESGSAADPALAELLQRRAALEAQVGDLRARKPLMPADEYAQEFEKVMIDLARVSREIRRRKS
jgi:hypothetical protein